MKLWVRSAVLLSGLLALPGSATEYTLLPALQQGLPQEQPLNGIARCGERLLVAGSRGTLAYSDDAGASWQQAEVPVSQQLTDVACAGNLAWAVGHGGVILKSADAGQTWALTFDGAAANQQWLEYAQTRAAAMRAELEAMIEPDPDLEYDLEDAEFAAEDAQLALESGPADPFLGVWFGDERNGLAVGAYGMLYASSDGGDSWNLQTDGIDNPDRYHLYSISRAADGALYLSGEAGLLYRSDDVGRSWRVEQLSTRSTLSDVELASDGALKLVGMAGVERLAGEIQ